MADTLTRICTDRRENINLKMCTVHTKLDAISTAAVNDNKEALLLKMKAEKRSIYGSFFFSFFQIWRPLLLWSWECALKEQEKLRAQ